MTGRSMGRSIMQTYMQTNKHTDTKVAVTGILAYRPTDRRHPLIRTMGGRAGRRPEDR